MNKLTCILILTVSCLASIAQTKEINKQYNKGKYELVIGKALQLLEKNADDPGLNLITGRAYTDSKEFTKAIPYLEKSASAMQLEIKAWSMAYLGKCYFIHGDTEKAVRYLNDCKKLQGARASLKYAKKYLHLFQISEYYTNWEIVEADQIKFHFQDKSKVKDVEKYIGKREKDFKNAMRFFSVTPTRKTDVFVWADKDEAYKRFNRTLGFSNADLCIVNVFSDQKKDYEICKMLSDLAVRPKRESMLIQEGLGVYFSDFDKNLMQNARKVIPKDQFHLLELWEYPTRYERNLSYSVGAAFVEFLVNKKGKEKLKEFLKDQTLGHAKIVYSDFDQLVKTFEAMLLR